MNYIHKNNSRNKGFLLALALVTVFYIIVKVLFEIVNGINLSEFADQNKYDSGLVIFYRMLIRLSVVSIVAGFLYGFLYKINSIQNKIKHTFDSKKIIIWALPCAILAGWHIVWVLFSISTNVPPPPFYLQGSNVMTPPFHFLLLYILGYVIATSLEKGIFWRWCILKSAVFFIISITAVVMFQMFGGAVTYGLRPAFSEYFVAFAIYGGIGALFGFIYYLSGESKKSGVWNIDWFKLIIWGAPSFVFILLDVIFQIEAGGSMIKYSSLLWMFIFGNTITTSFYKKNTAVNDDVACK